MLKLIQLGITLFSVDGELPPQQAETTLNRNAYANNLIPCPCAWTFNFQFDLGEDMYSKDSIEMLQKAGVNFDKAQTDGIDPKIFGARLIGSGLVLQDNVSWLSFHSGYDFGYLVKVMAGSQLPDDQEAYLRTVRIWFPRIYDIKFLFRHAQKQVQRGILNQVATDHINNLGTRSGLQDIADEFSCRREGRPHTAGSDAWLTGSVFWQIRQKIFDNKIPQDLIGQIWGLSGVGPPASAASQAAAMAGQQTPTTNGATLNNSYVNTGMTPTTLARSEASGTPQAGNTGVTSTPAPHNQFGGMGIISGAFSNFQYGR